MEIKPRYFAFDITDRCQSHCATCNGWQTPKEKKFDELSTNDWKFVLSSLHNWLGNFDFIFSGGEPFLREDIFEIADYACSLGLKPKVITNALALKNKCEKLIQSGFTDITISLNSISNPEIHNASRGLNNAFKITSDVVQNLAYLNRKYNANKTILIASVIMPSNLEEIVPLAKFANLNKIGINYQLLEGGDSFYNIANHIKKESKKMFDEMKNQTIDAIDKLKELKTKGYLIYNTNSQLDAFKNLIINSKTTKDYNETEYNKIIQEECLDDFIVKEADNQQIKDKIDINNIKEIVKTPYIEEFPKEKAIETDASCKIGHFNFLIDPYGNVRICFNFEPIGNLANDLPQNIWNSYNAEVIRDKIAKCDKSCKLLNCNYHEGEN